jgi:hypothetical protein
LHDARLLAAARRSRSKLLCARGQRQDNGLNLQAGLLMLQWQRVYFVGEVCLELRESWRCKVEDKARVGESLRWRATLIRKVEKCRYNGATLEVRIDQRNDVAQLNSCYSNTPPTLYSLSTTRTYFNVGLLDAGARNRRSSRMGQ